MGMGGGWCGEVGCILTLKSKEPTAFRRYTMATKRTLREVVGALVVM